MQPTKGPRFGNPTRLMAVVATAIALIAIVAACGGGEPEELTFDLEIRDLAIVQENTTLEAKQDDKLTIKLTSDETVTFHLHGYDLEGTVGPDMPVTLQFDAYATGRFPFTIHPNGGGHSHEGQEECKAELTPGEATPEISVSARPADEPNLVEVAVETENFELSPDGNHWHLQVNGEAVGMYANPQVTFDSRLYEGSGEYEIMVSLNNAQHCDYGIQAMTTLAMDSGQAMDVNDQGNSGDSGGMDHSSTADMEMEPQEEITLATLEVRPR